MLRNRIPKHSISEHNCAGLGPFPGIGWMWFFHGLKGQSALRLTARWIHWSLYWAAGPNRTSNRKLIFRSNGHCSKFWFFPLLVNYQKNPILKKIKLLSNLSFFLSFLSSRYWVFLFFPTSTFFKVENKPIRRMQKHLFILFIQLLFSFFLALEIQIFLVQLVLIFLLFVSDIHVFLSWTIFDVAILIVDQNDLRRRWKADHPEKYLLFRVHVAVVDRPMVVKNVGCDLAFFSRKPLLGQVDDCAGVDENYASKLCFLRNCNAVKITLRYDFRSSMMRSISMNPDTGKILNRMFSDLRIFCDHYW